MTKALSKAEKKERKLERCKAKQQKAASKTVLYIQPTPTDTQPVNLCDDCAYEFGECEGKPKFASHQDETLTGPEADRVIECPAFLNVAKMPTVQEAAAQRPAAAYEKFPGLVIVCSGGCGKTTEGMTYETMSGEFKDREEGEIPEWTCQECLDKAAIEPRSLTEERGPTVGQIIGTDLPDPRRFQAEEDFGTCPSCDKPLKRTALNRYQDAIRCTNGLCRAYRAIVKTISTGVK